MTVEVETTTCAATPLSRVLEPLTVEAFIDEVWRRRHLLLRSHDPERFGTLFGSAAAEHLLEYVRPEEPAVRLVRRNERLEGYRLADGAVDVVRVRNAFADGYTLVLNGVERYVPAVADLARSIEVDLDFETQVNAYITPPGSQGFLPHYDDHDVLILQVEGSKTWYVYGEASDVPSHQLARRDAFAADGLVSPEPTRLLAGDVLYIPRGRMHAAEADDEPSIHLTVGIHPPTVLALATHALRALGYRDDRVLDTLPPRYLSDARTRESLGALVREVLDAAGDPAAVADALGVVEDALVRRGRPRPAGQLLVDTVDLDRVTPDTEVVRCGPMHARVLALDGGVALQFAQSLVHANADHRAAFLFLARTSAPFRVSMLPGLTEEQQLQVVRGLLVDGFLRRVAGR